MTVLRWFIHKKGASQSCRRLMLVPCTFWAPLSPPSLRGRDPLAVLQYHRTCEVVIGTHITAPTVGQGNRDFFVEVIHPSNLSCLSGPKDGHWAALALAQLEYGSFPSNARAHPSLNYIQHTQAGESSNLRTSGFLASLLERVRMLSRLVAVMVRRLPEAVERSLRLGPARNC